MKTHTGAQLSTLRGVGTLTINGGTFSMTTNIAGQGTHMGSGRQPQIHNGNTRRSSRRSAQRRSYPGDPYPRQNGYDPGPTSGPSRSARGQHRTPTNLNRRTSGNADVANVSGGTNSDTVLSYHGLPPEGTSSPCTQDYNTAGVGIIGTDRNLSTGLGSMARPSRAEINTPADYDIYYLQLLAKQRGSPMWIPGPDMNLPTEYRRDGIRIGDVGILCRSEGFSFLFNIFLPADHPINEGKVPSGFEPFEASNLRHELKKQVVFGPKSYLTSASVSTSSNMHSSGLIFETSAAEGAVLTMPNGAITEDLMCRKSIKKYLAKNAETWYDFVSDVRGREFNNGDIRLVLGFDKVSSWGIATSACSAGERVHLEFRNTGDISQTYVWHCVGNGNGRVGPCDQEMQGIITLQEADRPSPLQNQSVFLRTLNFYVSGECWMNHQIRSNDHRSDSAPPGSHHGGSQPGHQAGSGAGGLDGGDLGGGGSYPTSGGANFHATQSGLSVIHPSSSINQKLLDKFPKARIAITEDADWMSVITNDDVEIPDADELWTRLSATREVCDEDGIITFRSDEDFTNSDDTSSLNFGSEIHVYESGIAMVDPLQSTEEKGKEPETRNFQDPSKHRQTSASGIILPAILPAARQVPAQTSIASLPTTTTNTQPTMPMHHSLPSNKGGLTEPVTSTPVPSSSKHSAASTSDAQFLSGTDTHEATHANTCHYSPYNLPHVPIPDTGSDSDSAPASPGQVNKTFSRLPPLKADSPIWQQTLSYKGDTQPNAPAGQNQGTLQSRRPSHLRSTSTTTALSLNPPSPKLGVRCGTSSASLIINTSVQPLPHLGSTTDYRKSSPQLSSVGSPSPSLEHDSLNPSTGVGVVSSAGPASLDIAAVEVDAASHLSPVASPRFSPSIGSASLSGSISLFDVMMGRSRLGAANSRTDLSDLSNDTTKALRIPTPPRFSDFNCSQDAPRTPPSSMRSFTPPPFDQPPMDLYDGFQDLLSTMQSTVGSMEDQYIHDQFNPFPSTSDNPWTVYEPPSVVTNTLPILPYPFSFTTDNPLTFSPADTNNDSPSRVQSKTRSIVKPTNRLWSPSTLDARYDMNFDGGPLEMREQPVESESVDDGLQKYFSNIPKEHVTSAKSRQARRKQEARFTCPFEGCNSSFTRKHNLDNHLKTHCGITDFICALCNKGFTTLPVLKRHTKACEKKQNTSGGTVLESLIQ